MFDDCEFQWNIEKNDLLKQSRWISFEQIESQLRSDWPLTIFQNIPNYPNQKVFVVMIDWYPHNVPFIQKDKVYFLKTIFASRKSKKLIEQK